MEFLRLFIYGKNLLIGDPKLEIIIQPRAWISRWEDYEIMKKTVIVMMVILVIGICVESSKATITFDDGAVNDIDYFINDDVYVTDSTGGSTTTLNLLTSGEIYGELEADGSSVVTVEGGTIRGQLRTSGSCHVALSYGSIANGITNAIVWAQGNSQITITGAEIGGDLLGHDEGKFVIFGKDFEIDGIPVDYGLIINESGGYPVTKQLYGILDNEEIINVDFALWGNSSILLVPEPLTILLFSLGGVFIRKSKKRRKTNQD